MGETDRIYELIAKWPSTDRLALTDFNAGQLKAGPFNLIFIGLLVLTVSRAIRCMNIRTFMFNKGFNYCLLSSLNLRKPNIT